MSAHSLSKYTKALNDLQIELDPIPQPDGTDDEEEEYIPFENGSTQTSTEGNGNDYEFSSGVVSLLAMEDSSGLYSLAGADLNSPVVLVSDHYIDPKYKDFHDEDFDKSNINLSIFSIKDPAYGMQILIHELGHHLSHLHERGELSVGTSKKIGEAKQCILSRYGGNQGHHYLEEEFADEFAFALDHPKSPVLFCPFLTKYQPQELSLKFMKSADTHQPDLWRSLNQSSYTNRPLPAICKEQIKKEEAHYKYRKCL